VRICIEKSISSMLKIEYGQESEGKRGEVQKVRNKLVIGLSLLGAIKCCRTSVYDCCLLKKS
jgi:hypothetical protein